MNIINTIKKNPKTTALLGGVIIVSTSAGIALNKKIKQVKSILNNNFEEEVNIEEILKKLQEQQEQSNETKIPAYSSKETVEIDEEFLDDMELEDLLIPDELNSVDFVDDDIKFINNIFGQINEIIDNDDIENLIIMRENIPELFTSLDEDINICLRELKEDKNGIFSKIVDFSSRKIFNVMTLLISDIKSVNIYNDYVNTSKVNDILKLRASLSLLKKASNGIILEEKEITVNDDITDFIAIKIDKGKMLLLSLEKK